MWGIGYGTLSNLQFHGLITKPAESGPLPLTPLGDLVLDAVLALPGVSMPTFTGASAA